MGEGLKEALTGCSVVVIPAGIPRKPGMTRDDLFNINAGIVKTLATGCAKYCPKARKSPLNQSLPSSVTPSTPLCQSSLKS
jgi:malate dehydrogenase